MEPEPGNPANSPDLVEANSAGKNSAQLEIDILALSPDWMAFGQIDDKLKRIAQTAFEIAMTENGRGKTLTIALSNDDQVQKLNKAYRGKDRPTNVLSFPFGGFGEGGENEPTPLGDIILAYETVMREANDAELRPLDHVCHLVAHGTLHLLGFDHEDDDSAQKMESLESEVMIAMGLPDPYGGLCQEDNTGSSRKLTQE